MPLRSAYPLTLFATLYSSQMWARRQTPAPLSRCFASALPTGYLDARSAAALDEELMSKPGFSIDQLMELAGLAVASAVEDAYPLRDGNRRVLVVAGSGNNGGDGLVAARHLFHFGYEPVVLYPKPSRRGELFTNLVKQLEDLGVPVLSDASDGRADPDAYDVCVDAIFGFSFKGEPREPFATCIAKMKASSTKLVSVDVPSGWHVELGDTSEDGSGLRPDVLVSLTAPKLSAKLHAGRHYVGGRFLPPALGERYGIAMPAYAGASQVVEITPPPAPLVAAYVTAPSREVGEAIAGSLVAARLAACVNIKEGVTSVYEWNGEVQSDAEVLLMIKTRRELLPELTAKVKAEHPYDVPEVIAVDIVGGSDDYMGWVRENTASGKEE